MSATQLPSNQIDALLPLIYDFPFKAYREYKIFSDQQQRDIFLGEIRAVLSRPGAFTFVDRVKGRERLR